MTCLPITDPGAAARTAKNENATPGLPSQTRKDSTGRNLMVSATPKPDKSVVESDSLVTYDLRDLNRLISTITAEVVAARLREVADTLTRNADVAGALFTRLALQGTYAYPFAARAQVYRDVASQLRAVAAYELELAGIACSWCGEAL
jgi:hypothetical protein